MNPASTTERASSTRLHQCPPHRRLYRATPSHRLAWSLAFLAAFVVSQANAQSSDDYSCPNATIQYEHPRDDYCNPLRYLPSIPLAALATALYALTTFSLLGLMLRHGQKWMLTLIIGSVCYAFGMGVRIWFRKNTHSSGVYIVLYLFTTLSPCAFLATDYVLLGRIVRHLGMDKHLLINARKTTLIFVGSDVATFLIQAAGGGVSASNNVALIKPGTDIFLAGIVLQMVSFLVFTLLSVHFGYKIWKHEPQLWKSSAASSKEDLKWKQLFFAMLWTCIGFLIRSFFRTVELSQGFGGYLATHEGYIFGLDTLPLFIAIIIYIPIYPGRYLRPNTAGAHMHAYDARGNLKRVCSPDAEDDVVVSPELPSTMMGGMVPAEKDARRSDEKIEFRWWRKAERKKSYSS